MDSLETLTFELNELEVDTLFFDEFNELTKETTGYHIKKNI